MIKNIKIVLPFICFTIFSITTFAQKNSVEQRVDSVLRLMTLDEKIGQMNQYSNSLATGPVSPEE